MMHLILFGPPGSGKGTQALNLVKQYDLLHISTGDLFRYELGNNTPLGQKAKEFMSKGELVPDSITVDMLKNKMEMHHNNNGYILDGFPRTVAQAKALDELLASKHKEVTLLIALDVDDEEIVSRIKYRGEESGREDDKDENIIRNRIEVYKSETTPVFDYYASKGKAATVKGIGSIEDIFYSLCKVIDDHLRDDEK